MRKMRKKTAGLTAALMLLLLVAPVAQAEESLNMESLHPETLEIRETGMPRQGEEEIPAYFNLLDKEPYLNLIKECRQEDSWAYTAAAAMQNALRSYQVTDELDIDDLLHSAMYPGNEKGGNLSMAEAYFAGQNGPWDSQMYERIYSLKSTKYLSVSSDKDEIKQELLWSDTPQVSVYMNLFTAGYNLETNAHYSKSIDLPKNLHQGIIVGWNDDFSADNFKIKPQANGAWLVQFGSLGLQVTELKKNGNSVSEELEKGLVWVSYESKSVNEMVISYGEMDATDWYSTLYEHDRYGYVGYRKEPSGRYVNLFKQDEIPGGYVEKLHAVSFWTLEDNQGYEIRIDPDHSGDNNVFDVIDQSTSIASGTMEKAGYHTVMLGEPVLLLGDHFAVGLYLLPDDYGGAAKMAVEENSQGMFDDDGTHLKEAVSFYEDSDGTYVDMGGEQDPANNCIKVFTKYEKSETDPALEKILSAMKYKDVPVSNDTNKKWLIHLNLELDKTTVTDKNIQLYRIDKMEQEQLKQVTKIGADIEIIDGKSIRLSPKAPYVMGTSYAIYFNDQIKSTDGKTFKTPQVIYFTIDVP